jgi:hypothetical protein
MVEIYDVEVLMGLHIFSSLEYEEMAFGMLYVYM